MILLCGWINGGWQTDSDCSFCVQLDFGGLLVTVHSVVQVDFWWTSRDCSFRCAGRLWWTTSDCSFRYVGGLWWTSRDCSFRYVGGLWWTASDCSLRCAGGL